MYFNILKTTSFFILTKKKKDKYFRRDQTRMKTMIHHWSIFLKAAQSGSSVLASLTTFCSDWLTGSDVRKPAKRYSQSRGFKQWFSRAWRRATPVYASLYSQGHDVRGTDIFFPYAQNRETRNTEGNILRKRICMCL